VAQFYPGALDSLSVVSYDSWGLRWKYSNPPPHGVEAVSESESESVRVTLQLTVSQSVCIGVEPNLGLLTRDLFFFFFVFEIYCPVFWGRPL
jgi:hypothetical protein